MRMKLKNTKPRSEGIMMFETWRFDEICIVFIGL